MIEECARWLVITAHANVVSSLPITSFLFSTPLFLIIRFFFLLFVVVSSFAAITWTYLLSFLYTPPGHHRPDLNQTPCPLFSLEWEQRSLF